VLALAESLDHVGPMTRSSRDAGLVLQAIAGRDANDATSLADPVADMMAGAGKGVRGLRIGWDEDFTRVDMAPDYADAVQQGLRVMAELGAEVVPVRMPARLRDYVAAWAPICQAEAVAAHRAWFPARASAYGPFFRQWLERGAALCAADYAAAHHLRIACNGDLHAMMRGIDVFACPSTPMAAFPVTREFLYGPIPPDRDPWQTRYTVPFNFAGLPTISLPCGFSDAGLPYSIQFAGKALGEDILVAVGDAFQQATHWHLKHPPGW
jgi:amidase